MAVVEDRHAALERHRAGQVQGRWTAAGGLVFEVLARTAVDGGRARLVGRHFNARHLRLVGPMKVDERAACIDRGDDGRDAAFRRGGADGLGGQLRSLLGKGGHLGGREVGCRPCDGDGLVLVGRLPARADRADDLVANLQRDSARQAGGAVERECAEPTVRNLLFHLPARPDEDRRRPRLVDRYPRARDLRARGAAEGNDLAPWIDDCDDDT